MRSEADVEQFAAEAFERLGESRARYYVACYEACIPRLFHDVRGEDVTYNLEVFHRVVTRYVRRRKRALKYGYSLLLVGDNGTGKTMFVSFIATQFVKRGSSVYYTRLVRLDADVKKGFKDASAERRLEAMLDSDLVVVDEVGKENFKPDSYFATWFEEFLKQRYDDGLPTVLASNLDYKAICSLYGPTVESMLEGKYVTAQLESGDFRKSLRTKMKKDMGL